MLLRHALEQLQRLFYLRIRLVGLERLAHAVPYVRLQYILIRTLQQTLRRAELLGDVRAVAVLFYLAQDSVQLPARDLDFVAYLCFVCLHAASTLVS